MTKGVRSPAEGMLVIARRPASSLACRIPRSMEVHMSAATLFRAAIQGKDIDSLSDVLRQDVVFHSPVLFKPFVGRDTTKHVLAVVADVLTDLQYTGEMRGTSSVALCFRARVGERELEGIDLLDLDAEGRIATLTVFIRPMTGLSALSQMMAERLEDRSA
jgi:hypothetical protein